MVMHVTFDSLKTFYNILVQKLKNHRGNWNQNDPAADDYIKNRPFYSEGVKEITIIDTIVNFDNSSSDMVSSGPTIYQIMIDDYPVNSFKIGETYTVIWDNQTYECVAQDVDGIGVIGNASLIGYMESVGYEDTGEPFLIGAEQDYGYTVLSTEDSNHTLIVKTVTEVIKKLDKKFIDMPDDIVTNEEFNDAIDYIDNQINNLSSVAFSGNYYDLNNRPTIYSDTVRYNSQYLTDTQKQTARNNIGAGTSNFSGKYTDLTNAPEILQANWEMYNPNSNAYIANKPFGYEYELEDLPLSSTEIEKLCSGTFDENTGLYVTTIIFNKLPEFDLFEDYYFVVNGKPNISKFCQYRVSEYNTSQLYLGVGNASLTWGAESLEGLRDYRLYQEQSGQGWYNVKDTGEDWFLGQSSSGPGTHYTFITRKPNIQITGVHKILSETVNQLDEKYIPDTIARVDDIPQTDWNQNDISAPDFIKNKPDVVLRSEIEEQDAFILAVETGLISPTAAEDGSIYTDENGALYSL